MNDTGKNLTFGRMNPNYDKNANNARDKEGRRLDRSTCCCVCGKATGDNNLFLYLDGGGDVIEPRDSHNDDLAFYPIGTDCAKKVKKLGTKIHRLITDASREFGWKFVEA